MLYTLKQNLAEQTISEPEDQELMMRLAPLYQQDRELAKQEGRVEERRQVVENLLEVRFGTLDAELTAIIESILALSPEEFTPLLMQLSRQDLIARFGSNQ